ncbi:MAG: DNA polymerase III subunit delta [Pseudomonadota bacterium]
MVAIKAARAADFVKAPPASCSAVLVYGTDVGLCSERAVEISKNLAQRSNPPGDIIRIEDSDIEQDPDRLAVELGTVSMFGGMQVVRVGVGRRINANLLKALFEGDPPAAQLVVEAGNLKASDGVRKLFEATPWAAALPCYADDERDLSGIVQDMMRAAGKTLDGQARDLLLSRLGADRALSRGEIEKLILFTGDKSQIDSDDVEAVVGDASELAIDSIVNAAAGGDALSSVREFNRSVSAGESPQVIIGALQRHFRRIQRLRAGMDEGKSFDDAAKTLRPPIFFKQKAGFSEQCRKWPQERLLTASQRISEIARMARLNSSMEAVLAERLLLELSTMAKQSRN